LKKKRLRKKHIPSFNFKKISKRRSIIENFLDLPIIMEMKDGSFYAGYIDDYIIGGVIAIYSCKKLVTKQISNSSSDTEKEWIDHGGEVSLEEFNLINIKNIYGPKDETNYLEDILQLTINPLYTPIKGIECNWGGDAKKHAHNCNEDLHESLSFIYKTGRINLKNKAENRAFVKSFKIIRNFILENGGKIP